MDDRQLLQEYVRGRSQEAFSELVDRHLPMVYSTARRLVHDEHLAEDVAQNVFVTLVQKAGALDAMPVIAGWLYNTARHLAMHAVRTEQRRREREEAAVAMQALQTPEEASPILEHLEPAMSELDEGERDVLVLRYFEDRSLREVGQELGITEEAARKRVDRAVEKLQTVFAAQGITVTAVLLATVLAATTTTAVPAGLSASIVVTALAGAATAATTATHATLMSLFSAKSIAVAAGAAVLAGTGLFLGQHRSQGDLREKDDIVRRQNERLNQLTAENERLQDLAARLRGIEADKAELDRLRQWKAQAQPDLLRLRGMAGVARRATEEAEQLRAQLAKQADGAASTNGVSAAKDALLRLFAAQRADAQLARMTASLRLTPEQAQAVRDILMRKAEAESALIELSMADNYDGKERARLGKEAGSAEEEIKALLTPDQRAAYQSYHRDEVAQNARQVTTSEILRLENTLGLTPEQEDGAFAALYETNLGQMGAGATLPSPPASTNRTDALQWSLDMRAKALESVLTPEQLDKYRQQNANDLRVAQEAWAKMGVPGGK